MKRFVCPYCDNVAITGNGDNWDRLEPICCSAYMIREDKN